ncbi:serine protease easter-like protein [Dinothrombium tinctorium]|uniref:Serine protease easter-like protein n=1 Tax=Dinothrombium tinctorium TaxID=1965070 RepID=A0A443Q9I3_9ACAR|nr:serine protease easter-like protein [Dinothrombium tinctorium]RWR99799.1 serine protease easter-like protein [Dinothrombium tinctorium]
MIEIYFGSVDLDRTQRMTISHGWIRHPHYNETSGENDIALIFSELGSISFNGNVGEICLPPENVDEMAILIADRWMRIAGWGATQEFGGTISNLLRETYVYSLDAYNCSLFSYVNEGEICVIGRNGANVACGDSDGPLMSRMNGRWIVDGVAAAFPQLSDFNNQTCNPNFPSTFTRVSNYLNWIYEVTCFDLINRRYPNIISEMHLYRANNNVVDVQHEKLLWTNLTENHIRNRFKHDELK